MLLTQITIKNFRGIEELTIPLDQCTVLIGENNTGKTGVLEAVHTCLSRNLSRKVVPFWEYDFHLIAATPDPSSAPPIEIDFTFVESQEDEWPDAIIQAFDKAYQTRDDKKLEIRFRVVAAYDPALKDFTLDWSFRDLGGNEMTGAKNPQLVRELQQLNPAFFLAAVRDAAQHFQSRSPFWGPFTKNPQIDEATRIELEEQIEAINQSVLDSHTPFNEVKTQVAKTGGLVPLAAADLVSVEAIPARIFDMLSMTQEDVVAASSFQSGDYLRGWLEAALGQETISAPTRKFLEQTKSTLLERGDHWAFIEAAFLWFDALQNHPTAVDTAFDEYQEEEEVWKLLQQEVIQQYGKSEVSLHSLLQEFDLRSKETPAPKDAVRCLTIHSSKGLEFKRVYLIGLVEDQLPSWAATKKGDDSFEMREERRNCFVAITRAEEALTLTYSGRYFGYAKAPSRFLTEMGITMQSS